MLKQLLLSDVERARLFVRLAIHESIIAVGSKGSQSLPMLRQMAKTLKQTVSALLASKSLRPMLRAGVEEVHTITEFLCGILEGEHLPMQTLDAVMAAKTGAKLLVAQLITQQPCLREAELKLRRYEVGERSVGAAVVAAEQLLADGTASLATVLEVAPKIPGWRTALRQGQSL